MKKFRVEAGVPGGPVTYLNSFSLYCSRVVHSRSNLPYRIYLIVAHHEVEVQKDIVRYDECSPSIEQTHPGVSEFRQKAWRKTGLTVINKARPVITMSYCLYLVY